MACVTCIVQSLSPEHECPSLSVQDQILSTMRKAETLYSRPVLDALTEEMRRLLQRYSATMKGRQDENVSFLSKLVLNILGFVQETTTSNTRGSLASMILAYVKWWMGHSHMSNTQKQTAEMVQSLKLWLKTERSGSVRATIEQALLFLQADRP